MTRRLVEVAGARESISPLEPPSAGDRVCALMQVTVVDEGTGRAPRASVAARLIPPFAQSVAARVIDSGLIGVSGRPNLAFTPSLASVGRFALEISAPRFITHPVSVNFACALRTLSATASGNVLSLSSSANLVAGQRMLLSTPDHTRVQFATISVPGPGANQVTLTQPLGTSFPVSSFVQPLPREQRIELHRAPVSIAGRVMQRTGSTLTPLANANVQITKLWRVLPAAGATVPPEPPIAGGPIPASPWSAPLAGITPPSYTNLPAGAEIHIEDRAVDAGMTAKTLLDDVPPGATELRLSNGAGVGTGLANVLAIDADTDRRELVAVTQIAAPGATADWIRIRVTPALSLLHRRGAIVRKLQNVGPNPTPPTLNYAAVTGDSTLLLDTTGLSGAHQVRIVDPGPPVAHTFLTLAMFAAKSDAQGFYRLPALSRAGKIEVFAQDAGATVNTTVEFVPDYEQAENRLDLIIT